MMTVPPPQRLVDLLQAPHEPLIAIELMAEAGADNEVVLEQMYEQAVAARGWLTEAQLAASDHLRASSYPADPARARQALMTCYSRFDRLVCQFMDEPGLWDRLDALTELEHERTQRPLAPPLKEEITRCQRSFPAIYQALFECGLQLSDHALPGIAVSVQAIGQQLLPTAP